MTEERNTILAACKDIEYLKRIKKALDPNFKVVAVKDDATLERALKTVPYDLIAIGCEFVLRDEKIAVPRIREGANLAILCEGTTEEAGERFKDTEGISCYISRKEPVEKAVNNIGILIKAKESEALVNKKLGIENCSNMEDVYIDVIKTFVEIAPDEGKLIEKYCECMDLKNYTIKVHALKNTALLVGAAGLSNSALELETAAKIGKTDKVEKDTPALLKDLKTVTEELKKMI
ncbi:MAG: hypothetical protein K6B75_00900 [Lachnospiraceae bacterium]|nr:hypothetical protein [Lachnospiraceae bacterium]